MNRWQRSVLVYLLCGAAIAGADTSDEGAKLTLSDGSHAAAISDLPSCLDTPSKRTSLGKKGFLLGLAGLAAGIAFEKANMPTARSTSYAIWGLGWSAWLGSSGEYFFTDSHQDPSHIPDSAVFRSASVQGAIGESSNIHLIPAGIYVHPLYNDYSGGTDKLLTGSAKLGSLHHFDDFSVEAVLYWRLLTPTYKRQFGEEELEKPVGRYADWSEFKTGIAKQTELAHLRLRHQFAVGYSDIGDKGGRDLHRNIHRLTRNTLDHLDYTDQPEGRFFSVSAESGVEAKICPALSPCVHQLISLQGQTSKAMNEVGVQWNTKTVIVPTWWESSTEVRVIKQLQSEIYAQIRPWRYEGAVGVRVFKAFTPTVKYISPYLRGDDVGQTYFDFLHYNATF